MFLEFDIFYDKKEFEKLDFLGKEASSLCFPETKKEAILKNLTAVMLKNCKNFWMRLSEQQE